MTRHPSFTILGASGNDQIVNFCLGLSGGTRLHDEFTDLIKLNYLIAKSVI